ncbi:flagellar hook-associated protein FlgK [bacterium]|nr:flagellar hook-associated protein FlgK [bacterium]
MTTSGKILDIARQALSAQQAGLNVTGHNIANVNTPGYSRQRVILEANPPTKTSWGFLGNGVSVNTIERLRNRYLDGEIRNEKKEMGAWTYREQIYTELELVFNEPSDNSLGQVMRNFWDSWNSLSSDPESTSAREVVRQSGVALVNTFHHIDSRITNMQQNLNQDLSTYVNNTNSILHQIADLNDKISGLEGNGSVANDYRDKRDLLLTQLTELAGVDSTENKNGMLTITLNGKILLERSQVSELGTESHSVNGTGIDVVIWKADKSSVNVKSGKIKGLLDMRDTAIPDMLSSLDELANTFVTEVNDVHKAGYGSDGHSGYTFFDDSTTGADDIALSSDVLDSLSKIAASEGGSIGDGNSALAIAKVAEDYTMSGNTATIEDYFSSMMGDLGIKSREASTMSDNQKLMTEQLENQQSSFSGVSLDEEMTNMIKYQHAYEAAARLVTTVDEMMKTIIDMV